MAMSSVQTLSEALKTLYLDPIARQINENSGPVLAAIEKNSDNIVGSEIKFGLQYGRHGGVGARGESDNLPDASPRSYKQGICKPKNLYARINFSEKLMLVSKNDKASFVDAVSTQMEDITNDARDMMRRNLLGKSDGIMAKVKTAATTQKTVEIDGNVKAFYVGQVVDIFTDSGSVSKKVDGKMIIDVDYVAGTIAFADNVTCGVGDLISLHDNYKNELIGLGEIMVADSTIYGVDRSKNKWYNPHVYDKSGAFNSMYLQEAIDDIDDFTGEKPDFITCDAAMQRAYIAEQNTYKRNIEYKKVDGGYKTISYNDVAISKEKYMPEGTFYVLCTKMFTLSQIADWGWMDADGSILTRIADKAGYEASLTKYCELICKNISAQATITGITSA